MKVDFNPFYSRASEHIDLDNKYIRLFSPEVLTIFDVSKIWNTVNILRSSPGGGKTTLLRLFTPQILKSILKGRRERSELGDQCRRVYEALSELGVFTNEEVAVVGSLISFNNEYASLEYLKIDQTQKIRLFNSLLNVRIILSLLQSICYTYDLSFPNQLTDIKFNDTNLPLVPTALKSIANGRDLYDWACTQEEIIAAEIDNIFPIKMDEITKTDDLYVFSLFTPGNLSLENQPLNKRILVMLDDVHNLSAIQREYFFKKIVDKRSSIHIWISERFKALTMDEMFSEGNTIGRDIWPIELERFWSTKSNYSKFEKFAKSVANKRIEMVVDNKREFAGFLNEDMDIDTKEIADLLVQIKKRITDAYGSKERYKSWIEAKENNQGNLLDQLIAWRSLEILLFRDKSKVQQTLDFDEELSSDELEEREGTDVQNAARLFINHEYKIPYYYGISNICKLASFNIEQFLFISGNLFEEVRANSIKKIIDKRIVPDISPSRQETIIKKICESRWKELPIKVPDFEDVNKFLTSIGEFCQNETFIPNAWNSPGLNGIAILMSDRDHLKNIIRNDNANPYYKLAKTIATCISYNLIDVKLNYKCKGENWMIIYLNRLYCVHFNLPLHNGKFKERKLTELLSWVSKGYSKKDIKLAI